MKYAVLAKNQSSHTRYLTLFLVKVSIAGTPQFHWWSQWVIAKVSTYIYAGVPTVIFLVIYYQRLPVPEINLLVAVQRPCQKPVTAITVIIAAISGVAAMGWATKIRTATAGWGHGYGSNLKTQPQRPSLWQQWQRSSAAAKDGVRTVAAKVAAAQSRCPLLQA